MNGFRLMGGSVRARWLCVPFLLTGGLGTSHAQTADCDFALGDVDLFVHVRYEDYAGCPPGSGVPCTQGAQEEDLVGWGVALSPGPGTAGEVGTTNAQGESAWAGNGGLTNACVHPGQHTITLSVPNPDPYDPAASWPSNLSFSWNIAAVDATGNSVERFILSVYFACVCDNDQDGCTDDACLNGRCPYALAAYDPTTPEVCNARDDDCDGQIDEGLPPSAPDCGDARAIGCADKTREGFMTWDDFPLIAACGGAWSKPGVDGRPACGRRAGNHGVAPAGTSCAAADLCPDGWHVCYGPDDIAQRLDNGDCSAAIDPWYPNFGSGDLAAEVSVPPGGAFFASAARAEGAGCDEGVNDGAPAGSEASGQPFGPSAEAQVFGCGNMGSASDACGLFDRGVGPLCAGVRDSEPALADDPATDYGYLQSSEWAWSCGDAPGAELGALRKSLPDRQGGVLCCKDSDPSLSEVCDGRDNDSDTLVDEVAFGGGPVIEAGAPCELAGQCGTLACTPSGDWECADPHPCDDASCDGVDDDQDGSSDEDYVVTATTCGLGPCARSGRRTCVAGSESDDCAPAAPAEASDVTCDGNDGDCDGASDEDFGARASTCGVGTCAANVGQVTCVDGREVDGCDPLAGATNETCNALDDDCDGATDEGFGIGTSCDGADTDACENGVIACDRGATTCDERGPGALEVCDGQDNDCDGAIDEGFAAGSCADRDGDTVVAQGGACVGGGASGDLLYLALLLVAGALMRRIH